MITLTCNQCGAALGDPDIYDIFTCSRCGTKSILEPTERQAATEPDQFVYCAPICLNEKDSDCALFQYIIGYNEWTDILSQWHNRITDRCIPVGYERLPPLIDDWRRLVCNTRLIERRVIYIPFIRYTSDDVGISYNYEVGHQTESIKMSLESRWNKERETFEKVPVYYNAVDTTWELRCADELRTFDTFCIASGRSDLDLIQGRDGLWISEYDFANCDEIRVRSLPGNSLRLEHEVAQERRSAVLDNTIDDIYMDIWRDVAYDSWKRNLNVVKVHRLTTSSIYYLPFERFEFDCEGTTHIAWVGLYCEDRVFLRRDLLCNKENSKVSKRISQSASKMRRKEANLQRHQRKSQRVKLWAILLGAVTAIIWTLALSGSLKPLSLPKSIPVAAMLMSPALSLFLAFFAHCLYLQLPRLQKEAKLSRRNALRTARMALSKIQRMMERWTPLESHAKRLFG